MSSKQNHKKRSHRSEYRARAFKTERVSAIKPSLHKTDTLNLMRLFRNFRRKQPQGQSGRVIVGEPVMGGDSL